MQCACANILLSLLYEHIFDLFEKFKDTQNYSRTFTNFLKIQGQEFFSRTIQGLHGRVATLRNYGTRARVLRTYDQKK